MLHSMGDAGIGWKVRNATEWDEDVTQRVQKLHERIEPIFCWRRRIFFQLTFLILLHSLCFCSPDSFPSLRQPSHFLEWKVGDEIHVCPYLKWSKVEVMLSGR